MRVGPSCGHDDLGFGRLAPAITDVVLHRPMQERGVLGDEPDLGAQRILGDGGDVLAVDQDAAAFQIVEPQQQVDQRRLARTGPSDQPDLLARLDDQRQIVDQPAFAAVMEFDASHNGPRHAARWSAVALGASVTVIGLGYRLHAFLHHADILEDVRHHEHDPAGHVVDADDQRRRQRHRAERDAALAPQPEREPAVPRR